MLEHIDDFIMKISNDYTYVKKQSTHSAKMNSMKSFEIKITTTRLNRFNTCRYDET